MEKNKKVNIKRKKKLLLITKLFNKGYKTEQKIENNHVNATKGGILVIDIFLKSNAIF